MVSGSCSAGVQSVAPFCSANRWSRHGKQTLAGYHKHADVRTPTFLTLFPFKGKTKRASSPSSSRPFAVTLVYLSSLNENRYVLLSAFLLLAPAFSAALAGVEPSLKTVKEQGIKEQQWNISKGLFLTFLHHFILLPPVVSKSTPAFLLGCCHLIVTCLNVHLFQSRMCTDLLNSNELIAQIYSQSIMSAFKYNAWRKHYIFDFIFFLPISKTEICVHSCYPVNYFEGRHIAYLSFHWCPLACAAWLVSPLCQIAVMLRMNTTVPLTAGTPAGQFRTKSWDCLFIQWHIKTL